MSRVTYVVVACMSDKRWFDLDAVRHESTGQTRGYIGDKRSSDVGNGGYGQIKGAYTAEMAAAGAPPLDWWDEPEEDPMPTSHVVVACTSDKRWFDLDAVRTESAYQDDPRHLRPDHKLNGRDNGFRNSGPNPAGAPPLDWWDETDDDTPPGGPMTTNTITLHIGDVRDIMAQMPDQSVDLVVTSPPFLALRSYLPADHPDKHREIGSEATPAAYLDTLLELTDEWRRLLTPTGSLAVELGDTYSGSGDSGWHRVTDEHAADRFGQKWRDMPPEPSVVRGPGWPLAKSLCGIPTLYTWSLAYGHNLLNPDHTIRPWRVRNLLTWTRPNPPVGKLFDKFRPATSFVTVACDSDKRWFDLDAVRTELKVPGATDEAWGGVNRVSANGRYRAGEAVPSNPNGAPPLDWQDDSQPDWQPLHNLPTHPYKGAHYATYPPALPRRLIEAMCPREVCRVCGEPRRRVVESEQFVLQGAHNRTHRADPTKGRLVPRADLPKLTSSGRTSTGANPGRREGGADAQDYITNRTTLGWTDCGHNNYRPGIVLDPFAGSGTTAIAAAHAGRDTILIDLDHRNVDLIRQRIAETMRIVDEVVDGDTYRWTVAPASRHELGAIAAGQEALW